MATVTETLTDIESRMAAVETSQRQFLVVDAPDIVKRAKRLAILFG
jgi:hypothetical protein